MVLSMRMMLHKTHGGGLQTLRIGTSFSNKLYVQCTQIHPKRVQAIKIKVQIKYLDHVHAIAIPNTTIKDEHVTYLPQNIINFLKGFPLPLRPCHAMAWPGMRLPTQLMHNHRQLSQSSLKSIAMPYLSCATYSFEVVCSTKGWPRQVIPMLPQSWSLYFCPSAIARS